MAVVEVAGAEVVVVLDGGWVVVDPPAVPHPMTCRFAYR